MKLSPELIAAIGSVLGYLGGLLSKQIFPWLALERKSVRDERQQAQERANKREEEAIDDRRNERREMIELARTSVLLMGEIKVMFEHLTVTIQSTTVQLRADVQNTHATLLQWETQKLRHLEDIEDKLDENNDLILQICNVMQYKPFRPNRVKPVAVAGAVPRPAPSTKPPEDGS